jgi:branched-chain amino acid transport system permease protein
VAVVLSIPLARLRGVFQAIATLAFVQIVVSIALYADRFTGGATGLNGIPASAGTLEIVIVLALALWLLHNIGRSPMGRAFDTIRQDEHVAVAFGIDVVRHHTIAFALSGLLAGLAGGLLALHNYSVVPDEFGFSMLVAGLSYVIFGGRQSLGGPILGAAILTVLPEVSRPLADNRMILYGGLLMWTVIYLPHGLFDTALARWRLRRSGSSKVETTTATTASMPAAVVDSPAGELPSVMTR